MIKHQMDQLGVDTNDSQNASWQEMTMKMRNKVLDQLALHNELNQLKDLEEILNFARIHDGIHNYKSPENKAEKVLKIWRAFS